MRLLERSRPRASSIGSMAQRIVSATRTIAAPAEKIFDVLANPSLHPVIDGHEGRVLVRDKEPRL